MKDVEHYHQILIHMKEQHQRDVEEFANFFKHVNNMNLGAYWVMWMDVELVHIIAKYCDD
jgi:hypothetical protein